MRTNATTNINETHIIFIYGIKNMKNVKCRPHSYNTKQNILVCGLFFILLKTEL